MALDRTLIGHRYLEENCTTLACTVQTVTLVACVAFSNTGPDDQDYHEHKQALQCRLPGIRKPGPPRTTWQRQRSDEREIQSPGMSCQELEVAAQDRPKWKYYGAHTKRTDQLQDSLKPLRRVSQFFSLDCCTQSKTRWQKTCWIGKAAACAAVLGFLNFYTLYAKIRDVFDSINVSIKLTDAIQMCYDYCQYLVDLSFVHKYGIGTSLQYYKRYADIDQVLGITVYTTIKSRLVKLVVYFILIWLVSSAIDFTAWTLSYGVYTPTLYAVSYIFFLIKILNSLDLISHVMHIEFRLTKMKDQLQDCYCSTKSLTGNLNNPVCNKKMFFGENTTIFSTSNIYPEAIVARRNNHQVIKWLSRCYLNLLEQIVLINKFFGIRILLNSLSLLIDMIRFTNIAVRLIIGSQVTTYNSGYYPAVANVLRMLTCALVIGNLVAHCERVYRQADATLSLIDHTLINKDPDGDVRAALTELRGLVQSRRVDFHMAYFFRLDYSLLISITSVVVTYTIILVQNVPN